jgi:hypothetical protein
MRISYRAVVAASGRACPRPCLARMAGYQVRPRRLALGELLATLRAETRLGGHLGTTLGA